MPRHLRSGTRRQQPIDGGRRRAQEPDDDERDDEIVADDDAVGAGCQRQRDRGHGNADADRQLLRRRAQRRGPADPFGRHLVIGDRVEAGELERAEEATERLYEVLAIDPNNVVALKILGDIRYSQHDVVSAMANYSRILEIDPDCRGIKSEMPVKKPEPVRQLILQRAPETAAPAKTLQLERPFRTETVGDIYLAQGQPRLAMEIFKELADLHQNPRMREKLASAEKMAGVREHRDVE